MRFVIRLLVLSAVFFTWVGSSFAEDDVLPQQFTSMNGAFIVRYPADWYVFFANSGEIVFAPQTVEVHHIAAIPALVGEGEILLQIAVDDMNVDERVDQILAEEGLVSSRQWEEIEFNGPSITNAYPATRLQLANWSIAASIELIDLGSDGVMTLSVWVPEEDRVRASALLDAVGSTLVLNAPMRAPAPASTPAPTYDSLAYSQAIDLRTIAEGVEPDAFTLSPDGTRVAYTSDGSLCILNTGNSQSECAALSIPIDTPLLRWSPDSRYIAFTNPLFSNEMSPSILIYDTDDGSFRNLTRDDSLPIEAQARQNMEDLVVLWAHDSQALYSWRWYGGLGIQGLFYHSLDGSETRFIADFTPTFDISPAFGLVAPLAGDMVLSPDGMYLALYAVHPNYAGVMLVNLQTGMLRSLITLDELSAVLPNQPENSSVMVAGLSWNADGNGLYLHSSNRRNTLGNLFFFDLETNDISALIDYAPFSTAEVDAMMAGEDAFALEVPMWAAAPPNGDAVAYLGKAGDTVRITRARFVEGIFQTEVAYEFDMTEVNLRGSAMLAVDGTTLLGTLLLTP